MGTTTSCEKIYRKSSRKKRKGERYENRTIYRAHLIPTTDEHELQGLFIKNIEKI